MKLIEAIFLFLEHNKLNTEHLWNNYMHFPAFEMKTSYFPAIRFNQNDKQTPLYPSCEWDFYRKFNEKESLWVDDEWVNLKAPFR